MPRRSRFVLDEVDVANDDESGESSTMQQRKHARKERKRRRKQRCAKCKTTDGDLETCKECTRDFHETCGGPGPGSKSGMCTECKEVKRGSNKKKKRKSIDSSSGSGSSEEEADDDDADEESNDEESGSVLATEVRDVSQRVTNIDTRMTTHEAIVASRYGTLEARIARIEAAWEAAVAASVAVSTETHADESHVAEKE